MTLWEIDIYPRTGQPDLFGMAVADDAGELHLARALDVTSARGFLVEGELSQQQANRLARELFSDEVVEATVVAPVGDERLRKAPAGCTNGESTSVVHVLPKPGVMDPVAQTALQAIKGMGPKRVQKFGQRLLELVAEDGG